MAKKVICNKCKKIVERDHVCIRNYKLIKPKQRKATQEEKENQSEDTQRYNHFYTSTAWRKLRQSVLTENLYICEVCKVKEASAVHHVNYIRNYWDERLDYDNCIAICSSCHKQTHLNKIEGKEKFEIFQSKYRYYLKEKYKKD